MRDDQRADLASSVDRQKKELRDKEYDVQDYYKESGLDVQIATSPDFTNFTFLVIVLNGLWMMYDADMNANVSLQDAAWEFIVVEIVMITFFTFEIIVRYSAFAVKKNAYRDFWFVFDLMIVFFMWVELVILPVAVMLAGDGFNNTITRLSGGIGVLKIVKIFRLLRFVRLMRTVSHAATSSSQ